MIRLTRSQVQPIGVDLGFDSVKMIQLEVAEAPTALGKTLSVVAAAKQALPEEVRQQPPQTRLLPALDALRQMLRTNPFAGRHVVATLPRDIVHVKNLRLPMMPPAEVESAVQFEARNIFPFDTEQANVRHLAAGEVRQGTDTRLEVIALAVKHEDVNSFLEQLYRCGCVVESLDFEPCAIYRSIERFIRRREDENEVNVLVDVGSRRTQVIIGRGREINFFKPIEIGGQNFQEAVARKLGITQEEARNLRRRLNEGQRDEGTPNGGCADSALVPLPSALDDPVHQAVLDATRSTIEELAREISLCLRYYSVTFRGQRPSKVRLLGGEASDRQLHTVLNDALPIPVEAARPLYSVNLSRMKQGDRQGISSEWATALGAGLKLTSEYFGAGTGNSARLWCRRPSDEGSGVKTPYRGPIRGSFPHRPRFSLLNPRRATVEVIDLARAIQAGLHNPDPSGSPAVAKEAPHA